MGNYTWDGYCFQKNKSNPKYTYTIFYNPVHIFLATPMFSQNSQPSMTFHDHPNIFWIAHAGLAQLPDRHQKEPQCFQESRRTRCQWPMSWLHVHKKKINISQDSSFWTPTLFGHVWTASQQSRHGKSKSVNTIKYFF